MKLWLILILLSLITYAVVQRSVSSTTKTPVWLCWLVMMFPAFIWTAWIYFVGEDPPIPIMLIIVPLVVCPLVYGWLIQIGKSENNKTDNQTQPVEPENNLVGVRPINSQEEQDLRNCFPWNIYYLQKIDYRPQAILCRGKLKTIPEEAYNKIKDNVEKVFGDRFFLIFQESLRGQPFFALVPNPQTQTKDQSDTEPITRPGLALGLLLITLLTTTIAGLEFQGISEEQLQSDPNMILLGLTYSIPLLVILGIHELGHYIAARRYKVSTTLPYFIPFPAFIGTLSAFTQRRTPVPHRQAMFDIALSGACVGLIATLPVLFFGLSLSETVPLEESNFFNFEALDPRLSLLLALLAKLALGSQLQSGMAINLHPLAIAGYVGLLITALHLMPVGQLDGGNIIHGVFGQKTAIGIGQVARFLAILFALIHPSFWVWTVILWLMPLLDQPALNDVTELDNIRDFLGLLTIALLLCILLPLPPTLANWFNL
ncbi:MAG: site-2 protease family protein [Xenococcaceae cyanobacterium MO_207.B15]|nr:site-2 protease family protein [Xenococcaceae cyanobacterium MO_207.B15]MDJ0747696.1 site-2 protease family protein [Xenococcaceae cyanobacterium MO_167.B27]